MSETHVNAYANEVVEARDAVVKAVGEFESKQEILRTHPNYDESLIVELPFKIVPLAADPATKPKAAEAKA